MPRFMVYRSVVEVYDVQAPTATEAEELVLDDQCEVQEVLGTDDITAQEIDTREWHRRLQYEKTL